MRTLTIEIDEALYEVLAAAGPTPEEAAARWLADWFEGRGVAALRRLEAGLVDAPTPAPHAATTDDTHYRP